ncbi:MAG: hypothetical protein AAF416_02970 [Pseudomonadota bacterium]
MLAKIALTLLIIAVVFVLGQRTALSQVAKGRRRPRAPGGRGKGIADGAASKPMTDLVLCRDCGQYHAASTPCGCRRQ